MEIAELLARSSARRRLPSPELRRMIRERAALSQADLAETIGVSRPSVSRWETGRRTPRDEHLSRYVELLDALMREPT